MLSHELTHFALSVLAGLVVYYFWRDRKVFVYALLTGFFLDIDHLIDYFIYKKSIVFNLHDFLSGDYFAFSDRIYVFFHGYEYSLLLSIIGLIYWLRSKKDKAKKAIAGIMLALSLSMFFHLIFDQYSYRPKTFTYSVTYRIQQNFDLSKLGFK